MPMTEKNLKIENRRLRDEKAEPNTAQNVTTTERPVRDDVRETVARALAASLKNRKK